MYIGIYLKGKLMVTYHIDDYEMVLESISHAYQVTGEAHELRIIDKNQKGE